FKESRFVNCIVFMPFYVFLRRVWLRIALRRHLLLVYFGVRCPAPSINRPPCTFRAHLRTLLCLPCCAYPAALLIIFALTLLCPFPTLRLPLTLLCSYFSSHLPCCALPYLSTLTLLRPYFSSHSRCAPKKKNLDKAGKEKRKKMEQKRKSEKKNNRAEG